MGNLKNRRRRICAPRPPATGSLVDESVHVDEVDECFKEGEEEVRRRYRREYARQWQRKSRARIAGICAQEVAQDIEYHNSRLETASQDTSTSNPEWSRSFQRQTASVARSIVTYAVESLQHTSDKFKEVAIEKVVAHPMWKHHLPSYLKDLGKLKHSQEIVDNLKRGLTDHLTGQRSQPLVMAKDIVCALATSQYNASSCREVARVLGVDRRNIKKGIVRRESLDHFGDAFWRTYKRAKKADALSAALVELVTTWWTLETTVSPNRKDVTYKRVGVKVKIEHPKHYLQVSELEFFTTFRTSNPKAAVMISSFHRYHNYTASAQLPGGCQLAWNYFATGHGKGEVDGAGALLKREFRKEQMKPNAMKIQNATDVVAYLKHEANKYHASHPNARKMISKHFWEIKKCDIDRSRVVDASTVKGSLKAHQARSKSHTDPTLVEWRDLSCFCLACESGLETDLCDNRAHVEKWKLTRIRPKNKCLAREAYVEVDEEIEYGDGGQEMADDVCVGDNVAIKCETHGEEEFWILLIDQCAHILDEDVVDGWNQSYFIGDSVVKGFYYEKLRPGNRTYYLLEDHPPAYAYSHLIVASKFNMPPTVHNLKGNMATYELIDEVSQIISAGVEAYQLVVDE